MPIPNVVLVDEHESQLGSDVGERPIKQLKQRLLAKEIAPARLSGVDLPKALLESNGAHGDATSEFDASRSENVRGTLLVGV